jgi:hypothetical protein
MPTGNPQLALWSLWSWKRGRKWIHRLIFHAQQVQVIKGPLHTVHCHYMTTHLIILQSCKNVALFSSKSSAGECSFLHHHGCHQRTSKRYCHTKELQKDTSLARSIGTLQSLPGQKIWTSVSYELPPSTIKEMNPLKCPRSYCGLMCM